MINESLCMYTIGRSNKQLPGRAIHTSVKCERGQNRTLWLLRRNLFCWGKPTGLQMAGAVSPGVCLHIPVPSLWSLFKKIWTSNWSYKSLTDQSKYTAIWSHTTQAYTYLFFKCPSPDPIKFSFFPATSRGSNVLPTSTVFSVQTSEDSVSWFVAFVSRLISLRHTFGVPSQHST